MPLDWRGRTEDREDLEKMATPPPCQDQSARKRVKPGIPTSEERISGESQVSVIQTMSGLESKTEEVREERLDSIFLILKYRILSDE